MKNAHTFRYTNDKDARNYISKALKLDTMNEWTNDNTAKYKNNEFVIKFTDYSIDNEINEFKLPTHKMTDIEVRVASLFMEGYSPSEVAIELMVSKQYINQIQNRLKHIFKDL